MRRLLWLRTITPRVPHVRNDDDERRYTSLSPSHLVSIRIRDNPIKSLCFPRYRSFQCSITHDINIDKCGKERRPAAATGHKYWPPTSEVQHCHNSEDQSSQSKPTQQANTLESYFPKLLVHAAMITERRPLASNPLEASSGSPAIAQPFEFLAF